MKIREQIGAVFSRLRVKLDGKMSDPDVEAFLVRALGGELRRVNTGNILAELQQFLEVGTPYNECRSLLRALVQSVASVSWGDIPDSVVQMVVTASVRDQYSTSVGPTFMDEQNCAVSFPNVEELIMALSECESVKSTRGSGGALTEDQWGRGDRKIRRHHVSNRQSRSV